MSELSAESRTWLEFQATTGDRHLSSAAREALTLIDELSAREERVCSVLKFLSEQGAQLVQGALEGVRR